MTFLLAVLLSFLQAISGQPFESGECLVSSAPPIEVTCENVTMDSVLPYLPENTQRLTIRDSNIATLYTKGFVHLNLNELKELLLTNNKITSIQTGAFAGLPSLELLDLSSNQLKEVNETALIAIKALKTLNLANNLIEEVPKFIEVPNLHVVSLQFNHLLQLSCNAFEIFSQLKVLDIGSNNIESLHNCSFEGLTELEELNLKWNPIAEVELGTFVKTPNLKHLDFSYNKMTTLPDRLLEPVGKSLQYLTLANSNFASVPVWVISQALGT